MAGSSAPMSPAMLDRVAAQFRALAEPSRLQLMTLVFDGEHSVGELAERAGMSQANTSKHLALLHDAGWLLRRKVGASVVYRLADRRAFRLCDLMCARVRERAAAAARLDDG